MRSRKIDIVLAGVFASAILADVASAYYSPRLGRFLSRDPLGEPAMQMRMPQPFIPRDPVGRPDENLYGFVRNKPTSAVDPLGLWGRETHWGDPVQKRVKGTYDIAIEIGFSDQCSKVLADWDQGVDDVTPAWLFPQYHFDPGRTAAYNERWSRGVQKLKEAKVYYSWIQPCVYDGLAHIGEALHSFQDGYSHIASHDADTPWKHVTGPNSGTYTVSTRFYNVGDSLAHRPDDPDLWPTDHGAAVSGTKNLLGEIWKIRSVQCYCKKRS